MWIFSQTGFVSIVNHYEQKNNMLVRGRVREDVVGFRDLSKSKNYVSYTPQNDYPYRVVLSKKQVTKAMEVTIKKVRYTNFKEAAHDGTSRDSAYMHIWSILLEYLQMQPKKEDNNSYENDDGYIENLTFPPNWDKLDDHK